MKNNSCYKLFFLVLVSLSILVPALPVFADNGSIQVKCLDSSGNPIQGVKVEIYYLKAQKSKDKKSDAQGVAEFTKLEDGAWRVIGHKDGYVPGLYEFALLKGSPESVTLKMAPGADKKLYCEEGGAAEQQKEIGLQNQALEAYKQNKFADAEKLFMQCVEIIPSNPQVLFYLGVSRLQQAKFEEGVEALNQASKVATIFMALSTQNKSGQNPYEEITTQVQSLLKKIPAVKAENALRKQQYDVAAAEFNNAIKGDPNNPELHANLAIALTNAKKFDEALQALDKAIQLKPGEKSYTDLKDQIVARKENAQLVQAQSLMDDGNKLLQDGDFAAAIKKFEESRAMVAEANQSPLWRQIARAQAKLNQNDAAVESFKKSIELAPADKATEYRNALAQYYIDNKKYDEAVDVLADPKAAGSQGVEQALLTLAKASKDKEPLLAEAAMEKVIKTNPDNADAYFDLGQMYYADGKEKDNRTKELLTKYAEIGKDAVKLENAKNMLIIISKRTK
jgi:tetratricopeptide (TPR) repeat protein